ncbi:MAG: ABC transporter ATP-binding protein [Pseudomonadota bacterium]
MGGLLSIRDLRVGFDTAEGRVDAVSGVSLDIAPGEVLGLVGESGSGKSVTAKALMQLNPGNAVTRGEMVLHAAPDVAIHQLRGRAHRQVRGDLISMVFQEPMAAFAPAITIGKQMVEQLRLHRGMDRAEARALSIEMLDRVGITSPDLRFDQYAFELSGGMRQRAMIAMALSTRPKLLIADEPTTALDVTIQAQVLDLMRGLVADFGMGILFITHDLSVMAQIADRVAVMLRGEVVEEGPVREVIRAPQHAYTQSLIAAIPRLPERSQTEVSNVSRRKGDTAVTVDAVTVRHPLSGLPFQRKKHVTAVEDVSLTIPRGAIVGLVGESGSGKTTLGRATLQAAPMSAGGVTLRTTAGDKFAVGTLKRTEEKRFRRHAQLIFQDPYAALSPRMTVRDIIAEPLEVMKLTKSRRETDDRVRRMATLCKLNLEHLRRFPHAFSGGQRQRIAIARALISEPEYVVADEAVASLDVSTQIVILELLKSLQKDLGLTVLFISHDLRVVANFCDLVAVMQHGKIVEVAPPKELFACPQQRYTQRLLAAIPSLDPDDRGRSARPVTEQAMTDG